MTYWNHPGWEERKTQVICYLALLLQGQVVFLPPGEQETGDRVRRSWGRTGEREEVGAWLRTDVSWRLIEVSKPSPPPQVAAFTFQPFVPSNLWQPDQAQSTSVPATKTSECEDKRSLRGWWVGGAACDTGNKWPYGVCRNGKYTAGK